MAKREFIEIDNALKAVDGRIEELKKDEQFGYSKQIDVNGVKNHFFHYPIIPEQDIVKPYLKKLIKKLEPIKECEYQIYGKEQWNFVGKCQDKIQDMIDNLLTEQGDTDGEET